MLGRTYAQHRAMGQHLISGPWAFVLRPARSTQDMEAEVLSRELAEQGLGVKEATALPSVLEPIEYAQYPCSEPPACGSMASHLSTATARQWTKPTLTDNQSLRCGLSGRKPAHVSVGYLLWPTANSQ